MEQKNVLLFGGILGTLTLFVLALFFLPGLFSKKQIPATEHVASGFPTAVVNGQDASTKTQSSPSFSFFTPPKKTNPSEGVTLSQNQYNQYSGNQSTNQSTYSNTSTKGQNSSSGGPGNISTPATPTPSTNSDYKNQIYISRVNLVWNDSDDPGYEYIILYADQNAKGKIPLTGMHLQSAVTGVDYTIGEGTALFYRNGINAKTAIFLNPGDTVYVVTGRSPVGTSFQSNKCIGYIQQFQNFTPWLSRNCPAIYYEGLPKKPNALNDDCLDFVARYPICYTPLADEVQNMISTYGPDCYFYVNKTANYNYCVNSHKADQNFFEPVWHVYLERDKHIWRLRHDTIDLVDLQGRVISEYSY